MPRRARSQPESEGVNAEGREEREGGGDDGQCEPPIAESSSSGGGRGLTFQLSRGLGGEVEREGRGGEGGRVLLQPSTLLQTHHSPHSICGGRQCLLRTPLS